MNLWLFRACILSDSIGNLGDMINLDYLALSLCIMIILNLRFIETIRIHDQICSCHFIYIIFTDFC